MITIKWLQKLKKSCNKISYFIDQESIEHHEDYLGRRIKRGLFESLFGKKYNSDVNGSLNIGRKYLTTINKYTIEMHNKLLSMMGNPRVRTV